MSPLAFRLLPAVLIAGWLLPMPAPAQSQYPNQPIKLIVPYAPGGVPDTTARLLAQKLQDRVGQSVVVENRAGGNGSIGAGVIAAAPADGYTLLVVDTTLLSVSPLFISQLSYNPQKDFVPIAALARTPLFLAVSVETPIKTLQEFVDHARAHPGALNYGSAGIGSTHHLTMEAMKSALSLDITHVPYRGTSQAVPALLGNHVQVLWASYPNLKAGVEGGKIRLLANNGLGRSPLAAGASATGRYHRGLRHGQRDRRLRPRRHAGAHRPQDRGRRQCHHEGTRDENCLGPARHGAGGRRAGTLRKNDRAGGQHHHQGGRERWPQAAVTAIRRPFESTAGRAPRWMEPANRAPWAARMRRCAVVADHAEFPTVAVRAHPICGRAGPRR